jgi:hypothetical protein
MFLLPTAKTGTLRAGYVVSRGYKTSSRSKDSIIEKSRGAEAYRRELAKRETISANRLLESERQHHRSRPSCGHEGI